MNNLTERHHRLPHAYYRGSARVAFIACLDHQSKILTDADIPFIFRTILLREAHLAYCDVLLYLFMPDHCHIIFSGKGEGADTLRAMSRFKDHAQHWFDQNRIGVRWQDDFYDRILRAEKETERQVRYVLDNPVKKGLVRDWKEYPFKGSTVYDFDDLRI